MGEVELIMGSSVEPSKPSFDLSKLSICFLAGTLGQGGAERQLFYMLRVLAEAGASLRVLSLTRGETWEQPIRNLGVPITWVGQNPSRLARLVRIIRELRQDVPDVFQSQHAYTNLYTTLSARFLHTHEVGAVRNNGFSDIEDSGRLLGRWSLLFPKFLAVNSFSAIRNIESIGIPRNKIIYIPNVVDISIFSLPTNPKEANGIVRILAVGRLTPQKRFDRLLTVIAQIILVEGKKIKLDIVGSGPEMDELQEVANTMGLTSNGVEFHRANEDIVSWYQASDILVLSSDWEGTPNVILEAMSCGLPVVATRVGGVPELVLSGETGFLVDPEDEAGMAAALLQLIRNPRLRYELGQRGRQFVIQNHTLEKLPEYLRELYQKVLS